MEATAKETSRRARTKSAKKTRSDATPAIATTIATTTTTDVTLVDPQRIAAKIAAQTAVEVANTAIWRHPPKVRLAHTGDYVTIADAYGNQLPVVRIANAWVPLTEESLLESQLKSPEPNFGVVPRYSRTAKGQSAPVDRTTRPATTPHIPETTADTIQPMDERKPAALETRNCGNGIEEQSILQSIVDATRATPMDLVGDDAPTELSEDDMMSEDFDCADDDSTNFGGSVESLGTNVSYASVSTMGQSVVTWAQVASHHIFDPSLGAADTAIHSDSEEVELRFPTRSTLTKLESKRTKDRKAATQQMSSLQVAYNQGPTNQPESAEQRAPIRPPQRDAQGRLLFTDEEETDEVHGADSDLVVYDTAPKSRYAVRILRKKMLEMKEDNENLTAMVQKLNLAVAQLLTNQPQMVDARQPLDLTIGQHERTYPDEVIEQVSTDIVEWSPSRHRRRSKKTVLQSMERSPPRHRPEHRRSRRRSGSRNLPSPIDLER